MRVACGLVMAFVCSAALAIEPPQRTLSFEDRVNAQAAIERVYYGHQLGATKSFEEAVSRAVLENKVRKYLEQTSALKVYWKTAVTDQTLQRELVRMAQGTRMPERLEELYAALGHDPFLVKECLARPALVDRLTHNFYAFDPTLHVTARAQIDELHSQLASGELSPKADHPNRTVSELVASESESGPPGAPSLQRRVTPDEFQKRLTELPTSVGQIEEVKETRDAFAVRVVLSQTATSVRVASYVVPKTTWDAWWAAVHSTVRGESVTAVASGLVDLPEPHEGRPVGPSATCVEGSWDNGSLDDLPDPRVQHTAVWTGSLMVVWGGYGDGLYLSTGGRYDPATDTWTPTSMMGAPSARVDHTAVWTGNRMVIWGGGNLASHNTGGYSYHTGGRYDPVTDGWTPTSTTNSPSDRKQHTAVWTGNLMVVWGGYDAASDNYLDTGGRYNPTTDIWTPTSTTGAPPPRNAHSAVWTGSLMVVWGGGTNTGGRYDPAADSWSPTSTTGASPARSLHSAVWTGSLMVIWGGYDISTGRYLNTGRRYDPATDTWTFTSTSGAPSARINPTAVWTGTLMVVWGGDDGTGYNTNTGGRYDPANGNWTPMSTTASPSPRVYHTAVWTGSVMVVWGGDEGGERTNTGGRYDPATNYWTPTSTTGAPSPRFNHTAVWSGSLMVVWGGGDSFSSSNTGGRYDPATDSWTTTSTTGAPSARGQHTAVWTGSRMVIWGGYDVSVVGGNAVDTGGRYDPEADSWAPTATTDAPLARGLHTAVWTGRLMVVWGGYHLSNGSANAALLDTGGRYDPATDSWTPTSTTSAPSARYRHTAVWSGSLMMVWAGEDYDGVLNSGRLYDPAIDRWTSISTTGAPSARAHHTVLWTGSLMVVWGGNPNSEHFLNTGGRYDPATDTWTPTSTTGAPSARFNHTAVWTGNLMLVWGGYDEYTSNDTGGRYDPEADSWTPESTWGEPIERGDQTAVWTGDMMIVWGGSYLNGRAGLSSGGRYFLAAAADNDGDGYNPCQGDCDDNNASIHPGAFETCNGVDDDCDGINDEDGDSLCDDGNFCTSDSCDSQSGCVHVPAPAETLCNDHNSCTVDHADENAGCACSHEPSSPGTLCNDNNACTVGEVCNGGAALNSCTGGSPLNCGDDNPCTNDSCNPTTGCVHSDNSNACDDGSVCSTGDHCEGGVCYGGPSISCDDGNSCTDDLCDAAVGCLTINNTEPCNDGNNCTVNDTCGNGTCNSGALVVCDDSNACTTDTCFPNLGCVSSSNTNPCSDGNACTTGDVCANGVCNSGAPAVCNDNNPCTNDTCNTGTGCLFTNNSDTCTDGNACTTGDRCGGGTCSGTTIGCDDGNPCNGVESCNPAVGCVSGMPLVCNDTNHCTTDSCNPTTGCVFTNNAASCDDGSACTTGDVCGGGSCHGSEIVCNDTNLCTTDTCNPATGCVFTNNSNSCNDANACTQLDVCANGACVGSNPVVCGALDQCHAPGVCDPASGACSNPTRPDGTACNDGDLCTTGETCELGSCTPAFSGLTEPNPRSNGWYKRLCHGPHSGDQLKDADAACVASVAPTFAGISNVADLCAELEPSQPNSDPCDRSDDDLMVLALNICRARVCTAQGIDSQCGGNDNVGQSLTESDAILRSASRNDTTCAHAKCLDEEVNTGRALELNTLTLRREGSAVRLDWRPPYLDDGTAHPGKYRIWRRTQGSLAPFAVVGVTTNATFLDTLSGSGAFEYEVTAVMNN